MRVVAGVLGLVFAAMHGAAIPSMLRAPEAARGSGEAGAIPYALRVLWAVAVAITAAGALAVLVTDGAVAVVVLAAGVVAIVGLAIANGFWMKGKPTVSHHAVRIALALVVLVPALLSV